MFNPEKVSIEKLGGTTVAQRHVPRDSFARPPDGHAWDALHRGYFNG
jgi:hypothetical protein